MAEIKMSYILIEKESHPTKDTKGIILDIIDDVVQNRENETIKVNDTEINYRIVQKSIEKRCFLEMFVKSGTTKNIQALQTVDNTLRTSRQQRYYHYILEYDGISENYCIRLFPKYAKFERKIRSFVLFILTKAYGSDWKEETVSNELMNTIQRNANARVSLNTVLENMDFSNLESYLFDERNVNYSEIINEKLSKNNLKKLEKHEICKIIEEMRPTSLWERHFQKYGSQETWKENMEELRRTRNKVAHQKYISSEDFKHINKKLNSINNNLNKAIEEIRESNFSDYSIVDILGNFAITAESMKYDIALSQSIIDVVTSFSDKIQKISKQVQNSGMIKIYEEYINLITYFNDNIEKQKVLNNMSSIIEKVGSIAMLINDKTDSVDE